MPPRRYFTKQNLVNQNSVLIEDEMFHHICHVCREDVGSQFEVLSQGYAYEVKIIEKNKRQALAQILVSRELPPLPAPQINLCLSMPKIATFEAVLEKACELGVASIQPFF